jgi:hypothetical protein
MAASPSRAPPVRAARRAAASAGAVSPFAVRNKSVVVANFGQTCLASSPFLTFEPAPGLPAGSESGAHPQKEGNSTVPPAFCRAPRGVNLISRGLIADDLVRASAFDAPAAKRLARSAGGWDGAPARGGRDALVRGRPGGRAGPGGRGRAGHRGRRPAHLGAGAGRAGGRRRLRRGREATAAVRARVPSRLRPCPRRGWPRCARQQRRRLRPAAGARALLVSARRIETTSRAGARAAGEVPLPATAGEPPVRRARTPPSARRSPPTRVRPCACRRCLRGAPDDAIAAIQAAMVPERASEGTPRRRVTPGIVYVLVEGGWRCSGACRGRRPAPDRPCSRARWSAPARSARHPAQRFPASRPPIMDSTR